MEALGAALWTGESEQPGTLRKIATAARTAPELLIVWQATGLTSCSSYS
jgi:hypothetical protein